MNLDKCLRRMGLDEAVTKVHCAKMLDDVHGWISAMLKTDKSKRSWTYSDDHAHSVSQSYAAIGADTVRMIPEHLRNFRAFRETLAGGNVRSVLESLIERIQSHDHEIGAFVNFDPEYILKQEWELEKKKSFKESLPLWGVPVGIKDNIAVAEIPTRAGSLATREEGDSQDAALISRLRQAGAIIIGKTTMNEFAIGESDDPYQVRARNPLDMESSPGGSSSGSAAAVAAGFALLAVGTDTAGSTRLPASFCGTIGLKPTKSKISLDGIIPLAPSIDHPGLLAHDFELIYQVMKVISPENLVSRSFSACDRLSMAVPFDYVRKYVIEDEVWQVFDSILSALGNQQHRIKGVSIPLLEGATEANAIILFKEALAYHTERTEHKQSEWLNYGRQTRANLLYGGCIDSDDVALALRLGAKLSLALGDLLTIFDCLLMPTVPFTAGPYVSPDRNSEIAPSFPIQSSRYMAPFNLTGLPALTVPCGVTSKGRQIGLQIVGAKGSDASLLEIGAVVMDLFLDSAL